MMPKNPMLAAAVIIMGVAVVAVGTAYSLSSCVRRQEAERELCPDGTERYEPRGPLREPSECVPVLMGERCPDGHARREPGSLGGFTLCVPREFIGK